MKKPDAFTIKVLSIFLSILVISGCATIPVFEDTDYFSFLSADNDIYAALHVQKNRETLSAMLKKMSPEMKEREIEQILNRTKKLYAGIKFGDEFNEQRIELCAEGDFPAVITSALTKSKGWEKVSLRIEASNGKTKKKSAYIHASGISLALMNPALILLTTSNIESNITSYYNPQPSDWPDYAHTAVTNSENDGKLRAYIPNPEMLLPKILGLGVQLALDDAAVLGTPIIVPGKDSQLLVDLDLYFKEVRAVKAAAALLKLASMGSEITIEQKEEAHLAVYGLVLSIDALLSMKF